MLGRIIAFFLLAPVVELVLLIQVGKLIGTWPTIAIIVVTGVMGGVFAKRSGLEIWRRFNARLQSGQLPGDELIDGMIVLAAAALLVTPGVLSDLAGIAGMIPISRRWIRKQVHRRLERRSLAAGSPFGFDSFHASTGGASTNRSPSGDGWSGHARDVPRHAHRPSESEGDDL